MAKLIKKDYIKDIFKYVYKGATYKTDRTQLNSIKMLDDGRLVTFNSSN